MNIDHIIKRIEAAGFQLSTDGTYVNVKPAGKLSDKQKDFIRTNKSAIIQYLEYNAPVDYSDDIRFIAAGIATLHNVPVDACLSLLDDDDIQAITTGLDPERASAWSAACAGLQP